ncbi:MAG TPA: amidohydrolase [Chthoniobacterales bacterium]|nr:amidohydrolase [Chthoniobacterales bacterium]
MSPKSESSKEPILRLIETTLAKLTPEISRFRRHLHRNPELSGEEIETTRFLAQRLDHEKVPHRIAQEEKGIITETFAGLPNAPAIALRADIDALPIQEENGVDYRSAKPGVMHACGHDAHTAILLGTTIALRQAGHLPVAWRSIFQPSEETGHGALELVKQGAVDGVAAIVALHVDPNREVGYLGLTPGPRTAFCQDFTIRVVGRGGHGARPSATVDPIAVAVQLVTLIYQAVPRQIDSRDPVVVTIGMIQGGQTHNVIPDSVTLKGTIRALKDTVSEQARHTLERLCRGTEQAFGASISIDFSDLLRGMTNDPKVTEICLSAARELVGADRVATDDRPSLGGEDFADYLTHVPGCMVSLGVKRPGTEVTALHTSGFDIDEKALLIGARLFARILLRWPADFGRTESNSC